MKNGLTDRQEEILNFLQNYINTKGYAPSLREIGKHFNIVSTFGVKRHLDALTKKGYINSDYNISRSVTVVDLNRQKIKIDNDQENNNEVPIIGRVAAGQPILSFENIDGYLSVDQRIKRNFADCFALKVKGDSMINAGIYEDDIVIVAPNKNVLSGEIIIALIGDEATVKRFEVNGDKTFLIPENNIYQPIDVTYKEDFSVVGKVVGVIRWYN